MNKNKHHRSTCGTRRSSVDRHVSHLIWLIAVDRNVSTMRAIFCKSCRGIRNSHSKDNVDQEQLLSNSSGICVVPQCSKLQKRFCLTPPIRCRHVCFESDISNSSIAFPRWLALGYFFEARPFFERFCQIRLPSTLNAHRCRFESCLSHHTRIAS